MTCVVYTKTNRQRFSPPEEVTRHLAAAQAILTSSFGSHKPHEDCQRRRFNRLELTQKAMADNFTTLLLLLSSLAVALADSNVSCYRIEPGTIAGIIAADLLLTLIIVVVTYRCASFRRQQIDNADKVYMNVRANLKNIK